MRRIFSSLNRCVRALAAVEAAAVGAGVHLATSFWLAGHPRPAAAFAAAGAWAILRLPRRLQVGADARPDWAGGFRVAGVVLLSLWVMHGFARWTLHGTGDAFWYAMVLGDASEQLRQGVFPVFVGQSEFQFNGAFYPYRVAPAFHHLGALLDAITLHSLGLFALQNLLITLVGLAGALSTYAALALLLPARRGVAFGVTAVVVACPGLLGVAYNTDLYMSWVTFPFLPWVFWGIVRSFEPRERTAMIALGAALGALWWCHSPIALWLALIAAGSQLARVAMRRGRINWSAAAAGAAVFAAVAAYPVCSVVFFPPVPGASATSFQNADAAVIAGFLRDASAAAHLPMSDFGRTLSDFQLGYSVWALLLVALAACGGPAGATRVLALAALLLVLLLESSLGGEWAWRLVPDFVRDTTGNWVMNRLYLVLAMTTGFAFAAAVRAGRLDSRPVRWTTALLIATGMAWSGLEARKFHRGSELTRRNDISAVNLVRPENRHPSQFAYLVFPRVPDSFAHGVAPPEMGQRIVGPGGDVLASNDRAAALEGNVVAVGDLPAGPTASGAYSLTGSPVLLEPGRHYLVEFEFQRPAGNSRGILQLFGSTLFREYPLPESGGARAFGVGGAHANWLALSTSSVRAEPVSIRFVPTDKASGAVGPFARFRLLDYRHEDLPIRVRRWVPYVADVDSPAPGWLETARVFQSAYAATVDGSAAAVRRSDDGLLQVQVPAGRATVEVRYRPPLVLGALFWISATALAACAGYGGWLSSRRRRR